ncbi:MAG TPA: YciI-like protein [Mycobacteriales bacterium]|nr:YciI-like protein [Mycobacteriales bacterium]
MHYALVYELVDDYIERRAALREEHLALARAASDRGDLLLGGAFADPPDRALLVWDVDDPAAIQQFVDADPYVAHGLVRSHEIRPWTVVVGSAT